MPLIIPYVADKRNHNKIDFIRIKILCEGGRKLWDEELNRDDIAEILTDSGLNGVVFRGEVGAGATTTARLFYKVQDNSNIEEYLDLPDDSDDLCWRTYYLALRKSSEDTSQKYYFYLPCPDNEKLGEVFINDLFKYILKVEFNIDIGT